MSATISIARAGQELGTWSADDIQKMLQAGVLTPGDHFWQEGMTEWGSLACFMSAASSATPEIAVLAELVAPDMLDATQRETDGFQMVNVATGFNRSHREATAYRGEPLPRQSPWMKKPSHLAAALCLLFLILGLCISLLTPTGRGLAGSSKNHGALAQGQPSRAAYEQLLAQTHASVGPDGTILIEDSNGAALSLTIDYWKSNGRPEVPFHYEFKSHYDKTDISSNDDPHKHPYSEADAGMQLIQTAALTLQNAPDAALSEAIDHLVSWSVADAQPGAKPRYDIAGSDGSNAYFVRCEPAEGLFYLVLRRHLSSSNLQSMQYATVEGYVLPVTDFSRVHLWRYLIDHFGEIRQLAESYLSAKRNEATKPGNP